MTAALVVIAMLMALGGVVSLTPATTGVGLLCGACFLGVCARIAQAHAQHQQLRAQLPPVAAPPEQARR